MRNAILVPGRPDREEYYDPSFPTNSNNHWFPWLSKQLQVNDVFAVAIEPPQPWSPRYSVWKREFEKFPATPETVLVGHSCGGGFLVRWLSENRAVRVGRVVLVAPWTNPSNDPVADTADFFDFDMDPRLSDRTAGVTVFESDNDFVSVQDSVALLKSTLLNVQYRLFPRYGHFTLNGMGTEQFPELVEECLKPA